MITIKAALLEEVRARVVTDFAAADPAHDIGHLDRVAALAASIAARLGIDPLPAQVASYVHDYHRVEEARLGRRPIRPEDVRDTILAVLGECAVPREWHAEILRAVELTGQYRFAGETLDDAEVAGRVAAIVHDADNLDAIGAIGIGRAFAFGGLLGERLWDPLAALKETYAEGHTSSVLAHLYEKLVRLENDMLTGPGRELAAERTLLLHRFAADFRREWDADHAPGHPTVKWDPSTRFLQVMTPGEEDGTAVRVGFRGRVWLTFDARDHLTAVDLLDVPDALACSVPRATRHRFGWSGSAPDEPMTWLLDAESGWVWISMAGGMAERRLVGVADVEVTLRKGRPLTLQLHLSEDPGGRSGWPAGRVPSGWSSRT